MPCRCARGITRDSGKFEGDIPCFATCAALPSPNLGIARYLGSAELFWAIAGSAASADNAWLGLPTLPQRLQVSKMRVMAHDHRHNAVRARSSRPGVLEFPRVPAVRADRLVLGEISGLFPRISPSTTPSRRFRGTRGNSRTPGQKPPTMRRPMRVVVGHNVRCTAAMKIRRGTARELETLAVECSEIAACAAIRPRARGTSRIFETRASQARVNRGGPRPRRRLIFRAPRFWPHAGATISPLRTGRAIRGEGS